MKFQTTPNLTQFPGITRVEVIDHTGRAYSLRREGMTVAISMQDDQRTMKVFINVPKEDSP